jgi:hypothetical protein
MGKGSLALIVAVVTTLNGEAAVGVPPSWRHYAREPLEGSPERVCASTSLTSWRVSLRGGTVAAVEREPILVQDAPPYDLDYSDAIDRPPDLPPPYIPGASPRFAHAIDWARDYARNHAGRRVVAVDNGWLIGFNGGEYGGSLWWYPSEPGPGKKLSDRNVRDIMLVSAGRAALVFVGVAHMGVVEGSVLLVTHGDGNWRIQNRSDLPGAPELVMSSGTGGAVVITTGSIDRVSEAGEVEHLARPNYLGLYPRSAVLAPNGEIVIGMRFFVGVLRPTPEGYRHDWYVPFACARFRTRGYLCECVGKRGA